MKEAYPVQAAEYAVENRVSLEPSFTWWASYVLKNRNRIIKKVKSKYWVWTHKYGIKVPKNVEQEKQIEEQNCDTLWWDSIGTEIKNVWPDFEEWEGTVNDIDSEYQEIKCHLIFDIKIGENFRRKARFFAGRHTTDTPACMPYASIVTRDSVNISLTISAMNDLKILSCNLQNNYLTAKCGKKIWTRAGPVFGSERGKIMIIKMVLYGLKFSGTAFWLLLAEMLHELQYKPSKVDPGVCMRPAVKKDGFQ